MVDFLRNIPLWMTFLITALMVFASIWAGFQFAVYKKKNNKEADDESPINTVVGAMLGLLAFILAFTFDATTSRYDARKHLLLEEVNAIETTYLRAGLIPQPQSTDVRKALVRYTDLRVELAQHPEKVESILQESSKLQDDMWESAESLAFADLKNADIVSLFVDALNSMIDLQTSRVTVAMIHRLPAPMMGSLYLLIILSMMGVGYLFGMGGKANMGMVVVLSLSFAVVITLINDLDRSGSSGNSFIKISHKPMIDLQTRLHTKRN
jgi:CDP-diglyceride synthetase